jgi:CPA2 family monovalent cation:H+ antiporter-2
MNRGEFTLILATLSLAAGLNQKLEPFAGLYVLIMAILGPVLTANSERIGAALIRPRRRSQKQRDPVLDEEIDLVDAVSKGQVPETDGDDDGEPSRADLDRVIEQAMRQTDSDDRRKQN